MRDGREFLSLGRGLVPVDYTRPAARRQLVGAAKLLPLDALEPCPEAAARAAARAQALPCAAAAPSGGPPALPFADAILAAAKDLAEPSRRPGAPNVSWCAGHPGSRPLTLTLILLRGPPRLPLPNPYPCLVARATPAPAP